MVIEYTMAKTMLQRYDQTRKGLLGFCRRIGRYSGMTSAKEWGRWSKRTKESSPDAKVGASTGYQGPQGVCANTEKMNLRFWCFLIPCWHIICNLCFHNINIFPGIYLKGLTIFSFATKDKIILRKLQQFCIIFRCILLLFYLGSKEDWCSMNSVEVMVKCN